jgi:hypothetical protein
MATVHQAKFNLVKVKVYTDKTASDSTYCGCFRFFSSVSYAPVTVRTGLTDVQLLQEGWL